MFGKIWNAFLFILKEDVDKGLVEIAKNSHYTIDTLEPTFLGERVRFNIIVDRIIHKQFYALMSRFEEKAKEYFLHYEEDNIIIGDVSIGIDYETFVDLDAIRGIETKESLIEKIEYEKRILLSLIEGPPITSEEEYIECNKHLIACFKKIGLKYPNKMKNYQEIQTQFKNVAYGSGSWAIRRTYVNELYQTTLDIIERSIDEKDTLIDAYEPTGWASIDKDIKLMLAVFHRANDLIEFKAVSNMIRDILIKTAQHVYKDELHHPSDYEGSVSTTDFKRMIDGYFEYKYPGEGNKEFRSMGKKSMDLANKLTHADSTEKFHLTMCVDTSLMVIRIIELTEKNID